MKILVTYDPHNEAVTKTAKLVSELIRREGAEVETVDISQKEIDILAPYDRIVVGGDLWFGKFSPAVQKYLIRNKEELVLKPTYIFMHAYVGSEKFQQEVS